MFHHPMENVGGCIAQFADGKIDLLVPTNAPFRDGNEIAHFFNMAPEDVRLRVLISAAVSARKISSMRN